MIRRVAATASVVVAIAMGCGLNVIGLDPGATSSGEAPKDSGARTSSSSSGSSSSSSSGSSGAPADAGQDARLTGPCPSECNGGCDGVTNACVIDCGEPNDCISQVVCPGGRDCLIRCNGDQRCNGFSIVCPIGQACELQCSGSSTCANASINAGLATSFCIICAGTNACSGSACNHATTGCTCVGNDCAACGSCAPADVCLPF